jgi:serine/threonine protein kinase
VPARRLDRARLAGRRSATLVRGGPLKADLWTTKLDDGRPAVVKEFRRTPAPLRWWGRLQISREIRFLERLRDLPHVPKLLGRLGPDGFAMSYVQGRCLFASRESPAAAVVLTRLERAVGAIHARGVLHLDLRGRDNAMSSDCGEIVLLDWASAVYLRPGGLPHRLLFPLLRPIDESALIKAKQAIAPERVSDAERRFLQRFLFWRRLWPFNRKGLGRSGQRM